MTTKSSKWETSKWEMYQTGDSIYHKQLSIKRPPRGIAPGMYCILCPFVLASISTELYYEKKVSWQESVSREYLQIDGHSRLLGHLSFPTYIPVSRPPYNNFCYILYSCLHYSFVLRYLLIWWWLYLSSTIRQHPIVHVDCFTLFIFFFVLLWLHNFKDSVFYFTDLFLCLIQSVADTAYDIFHFIHCILQWMNHFLDYP